MGCKMNTKKIPVFCFFLYLLFSQALFSEDFTVEPKSISDIEEYAPLMDFEGMPSTIIDGCVNVLTGNYFESVDDYVGPGPSPITISRFFDSGGRVYSALGGLWDTSFRNELYDSSHPDLANINIYDRGMCLKFWGIQGSNIFCIKKSFLEEGYVNNCSPYTSGKHHINNKRLQAYYDHKKINYLLKSPGGESLFFTKEKGNDNHFLRTLNRPNGCKLHYGYNNNFASRIEARSNNGQLSHAVNIINGESQVTVNADDGRQIIYTLSRMQGSYPKQNHKYPRSLTQVTSNFAPAVRYEYKRGHSKNPDQLIRKVLPDNRFLAIEYCHASKRKEKVKCLYAPVGVDTKPVLTHRFEYHSGRANVFDCYGNKKVFHWNSKHRISYIETYKGNDYIDTVEDIYWGSEKHSENCFLTARTLKAYKGSILQAKTFEYDYRGNIIRELLLGNLSGTGKIAPKLDDHGDYKPNGCEYFAKLYEYNDDNLIISEKDSRQEVQYAYYPNTSLIKQKSILEKGHIKQRSYYAYDTESALVLEINDDGSAADINNLANVTERHIKRIETTQSAPKGLPRVVSEYYLDKASGQEVLLKKTVNTFTTFGQPSKEEVYGSDGQFSYSKEWVHDAYGNIIAEKDPADRWSYYAYDANKNCVSKQTPNLQYKTVYVYDFSNRLIKEEEIHTNGNHFAKCYSYDYRGNKTSATDIYGNTTQFFYDHLSRLIKRTLPPIPNSKGELVTPFETFTYNALNHPKDKIDANGNKTSIQTNLYGSPCRIENPDGSVETFIYNTDGTLKEATDSVGTKTVYQYDYQKRTLSEEKYSPQNQLLSTKSSIYNAYHLLQEIDPEGVITTYTYDGAGRKTAEHKGDQEILYFYDTLGREKERWELCSNNDYRIHAVAYDLMDQVIEESTRTPSGDILFKKQYDYDVDGNRTHETVFGEEGAFTTVTTYNSHRQPLSVTAADGTETHFVYHYNYRDAWGLPVPYEETIDPLGNLSVVIKNTHDGVAVEERKDVFGKTIQKTQSTYSATGLLLKRVEEIIAEEKPTKTTTTCFSYDPMGRETAIMEAYGAPEQKITRKEYNARGFIAKIFKPDGIVLNHTYDPLGRLIRLASSDNTLCYSYGYDHNDNVLWGKDELNNTLTNRKYNATGQMIEETLDNGLQFGFSYDPLARLTEFRLPDASKISYNYDPGYLREVTRENNGTLLTHKYYYGLSGKLVRSELMNNLGEINYRYDPLLRLTQLQSDYWKMEGEYDPCGNLTKSIQTDHLGENTHVYGYDSLYQLTQEAGAESHSYPLDSLGNRLAKDGAECTNNLLNQLQSQGSTAYTYDLNGNLTQKTTSVTTRYRYDAMDRLIEVAVGTGKTAYHYDPFHRRTGKSSFIQTNGQWTKVAEEKYLYQGEKEIGAMDEKGALRQLRVLGIGVKGDVGAAVLMEIEGETYVPIHDYRGNVAALLDAATGNTVETYRYTAYGEEKIYDGNNLLKPTAINPWRFSSKRVDAESGWLFFGRRYYDPETGKWTTPDPLWFVDGSNLYSYVKNQPTQFIDPEGLFLDVLCGLFQNTCMSVVDTFTGVDFAKSYDNDENYVCVDTPTSEKRRKGFDQGAHQYQQKGATYGPVYVTGINGICNTLEESKSNFSYSLGMAVGCPGGAVYNATHGLWDFVEAFANIVGIRTRPVALLEKTWRDYFNNCPEDGIIIHYCHSQGTAQTKLALKNMPEELRKRIHVIAVAPTSYIDKKLCGSVEHLVSRWDVVPWIDLPGRIRNSDTIQMVDRDPHASHFDHAYQSDSYKDAINKRTQFIRTTFGDLRP